MNEDLLVALFGRRSGTEVVVVTGRGVEIPIANAGDGWSVVALARTIAQIDALPETPDP